MAGAVTLAAGLLFGRRLFPALVALWALYAALAAIPRARVGCAMAADRAATGWGLVLGASTASALVGVTAVAVAASLGSLTPAPEQLVTSLVAMAYIGPVGLGALLALTVGWPDTPTPGAVGPIYADVAALVVACVAAVLATGVLCVYWLVSWLG